MSSATHVLMIEDEEDIALIVRYLLERNGFTVEHLADGRAGLERIQTGNPENVGERSAISTLFAILGRTALYKGKEATWKGEFGSV